jgi:MFS family permease
VPAGRRWSLLLALVVNALFGLLSAVARSSGELMFLRLMAGVGVGGSVPVVFALLAELLPSEARWGAGWLPAWLRGCVDGCVDGCVGQGQLAAVAHTW